MLFKTLLRLKDIFVHHLCDIHLGDQAKPNSHLFSHPDHNGHRDVNISILEFITAPHPNSTGGTDPQQSREKLDSSTEMFSTQRLNMENPKELVTIHK